MNYDYTTNCPLYLTGVINKHLQEGLVKRLKNDGLILSSQQVHLLLYLFEEDGISQKRLSELTKMNKISIVKALNLLESNNYALRVQNNEDQRNKNIYLTPEGKKLKEPMRELIGKHRESVFEDTTSEEIQIYKKVLNKMLTNMTS
ncbi:MarR family winged helix-turn-helix transcriptional regulator [Vibrio algarum]|uniref:HTH-type transcriptional regulator SarZ n=1 Tax=Vibrio algarum TaxID=3020714 RepID=A0ABT4YUP1_9VIBR|nr:MarR family transcriptional regulator [Vibrio sp. KJ40-1]MDB1125300.1 MarR family transcriptional regulator [Vibrio sp. KJ40-1]